MVMEGKNEIEEVREVTYLKSKFRRNEKQKALVEERVRKAIGIMGQVWGIVKRKFEGDWERRMKMFEWLV